MTDALFSAWALARIVIFAGLLVWIIHSLQKPFFNPLRHVPGPLYTRFTGAWLKFQIARGRRLHYIHEQHARYGPIVRISPSEVAVASVSGYRDIHRIGSGFLKTRWYHKLMPAPVPIMFGMTDPKQHARRRKIFAHCFSANALRTNWEDTVSQKAHIAVESIRREASAGRADVLKWFTLMATDVVAHLAFGESFRMLEKGEKNDYVKALENILRSDNIRAEFPWAHAILRNLPFKKMQTMFRPDRQIFEYGSKAVENARAQEGNSVSLFARLLAEVNENERSELGELEIRWEAMGLIVAGSDTTAVTLTYLVWAVMKNPGLQGRLEDEIATLGESRQDKDLEALPLLSSVIEETLRLYGAAPGSLPRAVPATGSTIDNFFLPEGTVVSTQAYTLHRETSVFKDPEKFDERRFFDKSALSEDQKTAFSPFGGGSRTCIGLHLARMELRIAAALFFKHCRGARLADSMSDEMMEMENRFLISPVAHKCEISL